MRTPKSPTAGRQPPPRSSREGLRPVRIWLPDLGARKFRAEAHRQSLAVATSPHARDDQDFIDAISDPQ
jgi:hypothetical protein